MKKINFEIFIGNDMCSLISMKKIWVHIRWYIGQLGISGARKTSLSLTICELGIYLGAGVVPNLFMCLCAYSLMWSSNEKIGTVLLVG